MRIRRRYLAGAGALVAVAAAAAAVALFLGLSGGSGSGSSSSADPVVNQYAAKFICGALQGQADPFSTSFQAQPLAPGYYHTDINVHNANNPSTNTTPPQPIPVYVQKKVVVTPLDIIAPPPQTSQFEIIGNPTPRERLTMGPDTAFEVDCAAINNLIQTTLPAGGINPCAPTPNNPVGFCKGYVVIEATSQILSGTTNITLPAQLDVTNVITLTNQTVNTGGTVTTTPVSMDFEYVTGKRVFYPCWSNTSSPPCP